VWLVVVGVLAGKFWIARSARYNRDMAVRPRIIFDTSGINKLEDGGSASEPLMRALECVTRSS
jgi:hypothetical protein